MSDIDSIDLSTSFTIPSFEQIVQVSFDPQHPYHKSCEQKLTTFMMSSQSWHYVDRILSQSQDLNCHFVGIQILDCTVKHRWNTLDFETKSSLRNYCVSQILSRSNNITIGTPALLEKFNMVLVEILKRDWPRTYSTFIPDIVSASQSQGMTVCSNSLSILRRLHDEVTVYDVGSVTTTKRRLLVRTFRAEFSYVYNLIKSVFDVYFSRSQILDSSLVVSALDTFSCFIGWMSINFICESGVVDWCCSFVNSKHSLRAVKVINKILARRCLKKDTFNACINKEHAEHSIKELSINRNVNSESNIRTVDDYHIEEKYLMVMDMHGYNNNTFESPSLETDLNSLSLFDEKILYMHRCIIKFLDDYFLKFQDKNNNLDNVFHQLERQEQEFIFQISAVLSSFYDNIIYLEDKDMENVKKGLQYLCKISRINDDGLFKNTLEFWKKYINALFEEYPMEKIKGSGNDYKSYINNTDSKRSYNMTPGDGNKYTSYINNTDGKGSYNMTPSDGNKYASYINNTDSKGSYNMTPSDGNKYASYINNADDKRSYAYQNNNTVTLRRERVENILFSLAEIFIDKMPRPEEVLITENEFGEIVKERLTNIDQLEHIKNVQSIFLLLGRMYKTRFIDLLTNKISTLDSSGNWNYNNLNKLCWSAGCLANAFSDKEESTFFTTILRELLYLCESKIKKEDKAVTASNILFLVSQFEKFLMANHKFTKTVIKKLFEFMQESHEGVQEMSCDTFLKISKSAGCILITLTEGNENYLLYLLKNNLMTDTRSLSLFQKRLIYEGILNIIQCMKSDKKTLASMLINRIHMDIQNDDNQVIQLMACVENTIDLTNSFTVTKSLCHVFKCYSLMFSKIPELIEYYAKINEILLSLFDNAKNIKNKNANIIRNEIIEVFTSIIRENKISIYKELSSLSSVIIGRIIFNFKENKEASYLNLASEVVKTTSPIVFLSKNKTKENMISINNQMNFNDHGINNTPIDNTGEINKFVLERDSFILTNIIEVCLNDDNISKNTELLRSYHNLILTLLTYSNDTFFNLIFSNIELFHKLYTNLMEEISNEMEISEISLKSINIIMKNTFTNKIYLFWQKYTLETLENILGIIFDKDKGFSLDLQCKTLCILIKYSTDPQIIPIKYNGKVTSQESIAEFIKKLFNDNFRNITNEAVEVFVKGMFLLADEINQFLLRDHILDFRVKIYEFYNNEDIEDEIALVNERKQMKEEIQNLMYI